MCLDCGSNTGPSDLQSDALPTELSRQRTSSILRLIYLTYLESGNELFRFQMEHKHGHFHNAAHISDSDAAVHEGCFRFTTTEELI